MNEVGIKEGEASTACDGVVPVLAAVRGDVSNARSRISTTYCNSNIPPNPVAAHKGFVVAVHSVMVVVRIEGAVEVRRYCHEHTGGTVPGQCRFRLGRSSKKNEEGEGEFGCGGPLIGCADRL